MKFIAALFLSISLAAAVSAGNPTLDIQLKDIDGKKTSLKAHKGKVMLVVNVADLLRKHGGKTDEELKAEGK